VPPAGLATNYFKIDLRHYIVAFIVAVEKQLPNPKGLSSSVVYPFSHITPYQPHAEAPLSPTRTCNRGSGCIQRVLGRLGVIELIFLGRMGVGPFLHRSRV
jgi:hypothetical protein